MSNLLFNRDYKLDLSPKSGDGISLKDFKVVFNVTKNLERTANSCSIEIYNLKGTTRSQIEESFTKVFLSAGYRNNTKTIFAGDIANIETSFSGTDVITKLDCVDGIRVSVNARLDASYIEGTKLGQIFDVLTRELEIPLGDVSALNRNESFPNGLVLSGLIKNHLTLLTKREELTWSIQDGKLQIVGKEKQTTETIVLLNPTSGLIGTPTRAKVLQVLSGQDKKDSEKRNVIQIQSLLNGELRPGRRVAIESKSVSGVFKIVSVTHSGDNYGNNWYSNLEVEQ